MYNVVFSALQCNKFVNNMMECSGLIQSGEGIGVKVNITLTTKTKPTSEYIQKMITHIENIPEEVSPKIVYMNVKHESTYRNESLHD